MDKRTQVAVDSIRGNLESWSVLVFVGNCINLHRIQLVLTGKKDKSTNPIFNNFSSKGYHEM